MRSRLHLDFQADFRGMALLDVEGETLNKTEQEVEHVWWGTMPADDQLANLSQQTFVKRMMQEQCSGQLAPCPEEPDESVKLRARRVNREGCVLTKKVFKPGVVGDAEETIEINDTEWDFYCRLFKVGMAKVRYTIELNGFAGKLQLDVFVDKFGHPTGPAKYDYEVPANQPDAPLPPLPITLINQQYYNPFERNDEVRMQMRAFMKAQLFRY